MAHQGRQGLAWQSCVRHDESGNGDAGLFGQGTIWLGAVESCTAYSGKAGGVLLVAFRHSPAQFSGLWQSWNGIAIRG